VVEAVGVGSFSVVRGDGRVSTCWVGSVGFETRSGSGHGFAEGVDEVLTIHGVGIEFVRERMGSPGSRSSGLSKLTESRLRERRGKRGRRKVGREGKGQL